MELPTYTSIWRIEKRLYKLYDFRLPMPLPVGQIVVFMAITAPYVLLLTLFGLPLTHTLFWLYVLPPGALTWLATRPVLESKRLPELILSQARYLAEPATWCRMAALAEPDEIVVVGKVWRRAARSRGGERLAVGESATIGSATTGSVAAEGVAGAGARAAAARDADARAESPRMASARGGARRGSGQSRPGRAANGTGRAAADGTGRAAAGRTDRAAAGRTAVQGRASAGPPTARSPESVADPARSAAGAPPIPRAVPQSRPLAAPAGDTSMLVAPAVAADPAADASPAPPAVLSAPALPATAPGSVEPRPRPPLSPPVSPESRAQEAPPVSAESRAQEAPPVSPASAEPPASPAKTSASGPPEVIAGPVPATAQGTPAATPPVVVVPAQRASARPAPLRSARPVERAISGPSANRSVSWRDRVTVVPGGRGPGRPDFEQRDADRAVLALDGPRLIMVLGCTVGAGQTVTTLMLADLLAAVRGQPVAAVDINPGPASLTQQARTPAITTTTLLAAGPPVPAAQRPRSRGRLDVIVDDVGARSAEASGDGHVDQIFRLLAARYQLTLADPGAATVSRVLAIADQLLLVAPASPDAARALAMTREWLGANGHETLAAESITVINGVSKRSLPHAQQAELVARGRCRAIVRIPWDDHLAEPEAEQAIRDSRVTVGASSRAGQLRPPVRQAYTALAGVLVAALAATPQRRRAAP